MSNKMTAAQRVLLSQDKDFYIPKTLCISISPKIQLISLFIMTMGILIFLFYLLFHNIFGLNNNYLITLLVFFYSIQISYDLKKYWKKYKINR